MEILNQIWVYVLGIVGGLSVTGICTGVIYGLVNGISKKAVAKINVKKITKDAFDEGVSHIKTVSFKHSIQPVVESELEKINEKSNEYLIKQNKEIKEQYNNILKVFEKFLAFFENSMVSEEKKEALREAITEAKMPAKTEEVEICGEIIIEDNKKATNGKNEDETKIIR